MLNDQDFLRYSRQMLLEECGECGQAKLAQSTVLIVGLGGLGSPIARYLAGSGVGKLLLADHDKVEISNLGRQILFTVADINQPKATATAKRLTAVNPTVQAVKIPEKLTTCNLPKWVAQADLVLDCSDNMPTRHAVNQACVQANKPLISASAVGFNGQLLGILPPYDQGCYACLFPETEIPSLNCKTSGILPPIVGIMGSIQALEALKYLIGLPISCEGILRCFDGKTLEWQTFRLQKNTKCHICNLKKEK
ncbi:MULTISPECIES: HesA/MoeB/ThiF family protein [Rodentibacter]|uniref:HesA/MoeB/ThiF family protein n=1 Tax=Rodentibacter TaxID=1960084 RepID=UPI001CFE6B21|nr:HesA/MoeB/ThiF family protein [Rodentibacter sp. JRC1]GJI55810.1 molybdopterin biosynthesis protein MoeB [Rodentibacter sp. JRC1]